jgi:hypothetical protein
MALNLNHQTKEEFANRFREKYRNSSRLECAKLATWLMNHLDAGDFTDLQLRTAFGLTIVQYNTLKNRMINLRTSYQLIDSAIGE